MKEKDTLEDVGAQARGGFLHPTDRDIKPLDSRRGEATSGAGSVRGELSGVPGASSKVYRLSRDTTLRW